MENSFNKCRSEFMGIDQALVIHLYSAGEPVLLRALGKCSWKLLGN